MRSGRTRVSAAAVGCVFVAAGGCGGARAVAFDFAAVVGAEPFVCSQSYTVGRDQSAWAPTDFRLYVHDFVVTADSGARAPVTLDDDGVWQGDGVALLDFEDKSAGCRSGTTQTNRRVSGRLPDGQWTGLSFAVGVPFDLNHRDLTAAPSPLNLGTMYWGWNGGYKFMRIDGKVGASTFLVHLGSTGCTMAGSSVSGCTRPNRAQVTLPLPSAGQPITVDLAALLENTDVAANLDQAPPGCMADVDDADCPALFGQLGLDPATGQPAAPQRLFSVR